MKSIFIILFFSFTVSNVIAQDDLLDKIKKKVEERVDKKTEEGIDKTLDEMEKTTEEAVNEETSKKKENQKEKKTDLKKKEDSQSNQKNKSEQMQTTDETTVKQEEEKKADLKVYQNYDFIPGEKIIFEDNFRDSQDGEFPPRWNLLSGQGIVNTVSGEPAYVCSEGSFGVLNKIEPAIKTKNYLSDSYTIEFDFLIPHDGGVYLILKDNMEDDGRSILINNSGIVHTNYFERDLNSNLLENDDKFINSWHHASFAFKNQQIKIYIDQHRVLVIPKSGFDPVSVLFGLSENTRIKNVKIAEGGGMNMLGKILTDGRVVTRAIKFDVNKASIKPESFGFLTELANWLKTNSQVKLSIEGHTDSDGDEKSNQKLSEQRAESVKKILVELGVESSRFQTKGFGESKPIDKNNTPEGKTNNRRVEFVKI